MKRSLPWTASLRGCDRSCLSEHVALSCIRAVNFDGLMSELANIQPRNSFVLIGAHPCDPVCCSWCTMWFGAHNTCRIVFEVDQWAALLNTWREYHRRQRQTSLHPSDFTLLYARASCFAPNLDNKLHQWYLPQKRYACSVGFLLPRKPGHSHLFIRDRITPTITKSRSQRCTSYSYCVQERRP